MELLRVPNSPGGGGKHLTDEQINRLLPGIVRLYIQGWPADMELPPGVKEAEKPLDTITLGVLVNRSDWTVRKYLRLAGVKLRRRGRRPAPVIGPDWFTDEWYLGQMTDLDSQREALTIIRNNRRNQKEI
jgi:hypothetical protein